jgi:phospholipase A2-like protein
MRSRRLAKWIVVIGLTLGGVAVGQAPASAHLPDQTDHCSNVPDKVTGLFDFTHPCGHHDFCYRGHLDSRSGCDSTFRNEMRSHCSGRFAWYDPRRGVCYGVADTYYLGVRAFGAGAYNNGTDPPLDN